MDLIFAMEMSAISIVTCLALLYVTQMFDIKNKTVYVILSRFVYGYSVAMVICLVGICLGYCK